MASYSEVTDAILHEAKAREDALPIRNDGCRSQLLLQPQKPAKICLFFHGFTAGTDELMPMAEALFQAGHSVLIPRLPGHGHAGTWWRDNPPPLPTQMQDYQQFALAWLRQAQVLGDRVVVGGLGGGGTVAAWLAFTQAQPMGEARSETIDRTLLFAPYFDSSRKTIDQSVRPLDSYREWIDAEPSQPNIGYEGFLESALQVFFDLGKEVLARAADGRSPVVSGMPQAIDHRPVAPLLVVSSRDAASDSGSNDAIAEASSHTLFEIALQQQPQSWYQPLDGVLEIPQTMLPIADRNHYTNLLPTLAKDFIQRSLAARSAFP